MTEITRINPEFQYDIRCVTHILHLVARSILNQFLTTTELNEQLSSFINGRLLELNYSNTIVEEEEFNTPEFNSKLFNIIVIINIFLLIYKGLTTRIRRIATMVKYITEIKKLFQEGIRQAKEDDILPKSFNKRVILLG
jgi:hypothetical protein